MAEALLMGWAQIAAYCQRPVSTIARYRKYGFPVFRWGTRVASSRPLIDAWLIAYEQQRERRTRD